MMPRLGDVTQNPREDYLKDESFTVTIYQDDTLTEEQDDKTIVDQTLSEFLDQEWEETESEISPTNFILKHWKIKNRHYAADYSSGRCSIPDLNRDFWNELGANVTVLTLSKCKLPLTAQLLEESLLEILPNLMKVSLVNCTLMLEEPWEDWESTITQPVKSPFVLEDVQPGSFLLPSPPTQSRESDFYSYILIPHSEINGFPARTVNGKRLAPLQRPPPPPTKFPTQELNSKTVYNNVRFLRVYNVRLKSLGLPIGLDWQKIFNKFPSLEEFSMGRQPLHCHSLASALEQSAVEQKLKTLDIMHAHADDYDNSLLTLNWNKLSLQKLRISCDCPNTEPVLQEVLNTQSGTLTQLHLCSTTQSTPNISFLSNSCDMPNLLLLQLWGNVFENLDFLRIMPQLIVLKLNTIRYDEKRLSYKKRIQKQKIYKEYDPEHANCIVNNTDGLPPHFRLKSMNVLEFERGPTSLECWKKLKEWMPGLTKLTCMVVSDEHFGLIDKLWPKLQHIEMAHGSRLSSGGMLQAFSKYRSFKRLKNLIWKTCSCLDEAAKVEKLWNETETVEVEKALEQREMNEVILPWMRNKLVDQPVKKSDCLEMSRKNIPLRQECQTPDDSPEDGESS